MLGLVSVEPLHVGLQGGEVAELFRTVSTAEGFGLQAETLRGDGGCKVRVIVNCRQDLLLLVVHTWRLWTGRPLLRGRRQRVLGEHGGRDPAREHREHRGHRGRAVAQHGGEDARVTGQAGGGLGEVLGQTGHPGPRDGGQLEQVLREGGVVGRERGEGHPGEEGEGRDDVGEGGGVDQVTSTVSSSSLCGRHFVLITFGFFLDCQIEPGLVGVVRLWLRDGVVVEDEGAGVGVTDPGEGVRAAVRRRHGRGEVCLWVMLWVAGRDVVVGGELRHLGQAGQDVVVLGLQQRLPVDLVELVDEALQPGPTEGEVVGPLVEQSLDRGHVTLPLPDHQLLRGGGRLALVPVDGVGSGCILKLLGSDVFSQGV